MATVNPPRPAGSTIASPSGSASRTGTAALDKAADVMSKADRMYDVAADAAQDTVRHLAEQGREARERAEEVAASASVAVRRSLREQPMTTLAVAAVVGFVVGAMWKS